MTDEATPGRSGSATVRPIAWCSRPNGGSFVSDEARNNVPIYREVYNVPLYDQAALEAARDEGHALGREAEAEYWRSMVERLTAQADAWNTRYMALVQQVADGRATQPAPAFVLTAWKCTKCGTDRLKDACPLGTAAQADGRCPCVGVAALKA